MKAIVGLIIAVLILIAGIVIVVIPEIRFRQNVSGKLKQTADANNIELAINKLGEVVLFLEENNLTT